MADNFDDNTAFVSLSEGHHGDPFALLGCHQSARGYVIRVLAPGARSVDILDRASGALRGPLSLVEGEDLFEGYFEQDAPYLLKIDWNGTIQITEDPYSFAPLLGELDLYYLAEGRHRDLASCLGPQLMEIDGVAGVRFAVWAPNARRVSVVGDFNGWDGRRHPMRLRHQAGVWEIFIPRLQAGAVYKYEIIGPQGLLPLKADPVARQVEMPPATASIVSDTGNVILNSAPLRQAGPQGPDVPLAIYEVHAGSWMRHYNGASYNWNELAARLIPYVVDLGFTHIEFMPVMAHPFRGSWGYQPLSQFAPMPEFGAPKDFALFVDRCHEAGLGVILDWVPAHFPSDAHGLVQFDGTALYEHGNPLEGFHQDWNTLIYNFGRNEVRGFLIASALFWLEQFGVDGLRVDAVASMLYRDYSRKAGAWIPNIHGGRENLEAVCFLQELSRAIAERCPGALLIAEESTAWPGVTKSADERGLGFSHKWNMGWMHDSLHYMQEDPINRRYHHDNMTFGLIYAYSEKFILPISHDEVVYGKRSLLGRMPGDEWQRFANMRAYLGFMWTHPGKKLLFMGCEFGQPGEWSHDGELSWNILQYPLHRGVQSLVRDLNSIYRREGAMYQRDFDYDGFRWVVGDDREQSVFAYLRFGMQGAQPLLIICNMTPVPRYDYRIGVPAGGGWQEIFNSDAAVYGGGNIGNHGVITAGEGGQHGFAAALTLTLPPLATIIMRLDG